MPPRPLKVCRHAGCHELTRDPSGYCPKHKDAAEARARKWKASGTASGERISARVRCEVAEAAGADPYG
ncbi:MAG: hypothetical protein ACLSTO_03750 [Bilophila wadsworthia]